MTPFQTAYANYFHCTHTSGNVDARAKREFQTAYANYFHCTPTGVPATPTSLPVSNRLRELFSLHKESIHLHCRLDWFQTAYANYFHCTSIVLTGTEGRKKSFKPLTRIIFTAHQLALRRPVVNENSFKPLTRIIFTARDASGYRPDASTSFKPLTRIIFTAQLVVVCPKRGGETRSFKPLTRIIFTAHGSQQQGGDAVLRAFQTAYANYFHCTSWYLG